MMIIIKEHQSLLRISVLALHKFTSLRHMETETEDAPVSLYKVFTNSLQWEAAWDKLSPSYPQSNIEKQRNYQ